MRTIVTKTNVYTIEELKQVDSSAYQTALENLSSRWHDDIMEFDWSEVKDSLVAFLNMFSLKVQDYQVGLYNPSYITDNTDEYRERTNDEINDDVQMLNEWLLKGSFEDLTGMWSDYMVFSYFTKNNIKEVTYNDIHKHLQEVSEYTLNDFIEMAETNLETEEYILDFAHGGEYEFDENGSIH